ncbi:MAG TPA: class E sortase [Actinomycetota bacterium]|nr:class E sortase [Actinomycetota bacterium]
MAVLQKRSVPDAGAPPEPRGRAGRHRRPRGAPVDPSVPSRAARARGRRTLRAIGNALVAFGVLAALFTAYELWGTGLVTARAQSSLRDDVALHGLVDYGTLEGNQRGGPIPGGAIGYIKIPKIGLDMIFVQGVSVDVLRKGPGHYPDSALPGQKGNVSIAGHRTTYLHPFRSLDKLKKGDRIILRTRKGNFVYAVEWVRVVQPSETSVVAPTPRPSITLTTCNPRFSASQRLIVRGTLVFSPGDA